MQRAIRLTPLLLVLWWVLTGGDPKDWAAGIVFVVLAVAAQHVLSPSAPHAPRLQWSAVPAFVAYFVWRSLLAGLDVARRVFLPSMPLSPAFLEIPTRLPAGPSQVMLVATLSLLPGTLGVEVEDDRLTLHVLDDTHDVASDVRQAERRIGALFGVASA